MTDTLFSHFTLGPCYLRNRIGVAPMTRMSSPGDSIPRQDVLEFLVTRALKGAAIVYSEAIVTDYESARAIRARRGSQPSARSTPGGGLQTTYAPRVASPSCRCSTADAWPGRRSTRRAAPSVPVL